MNLLLDTHSFLWFAAGISQMSAKARTLIEDPANDKFLSLASIGEMGIKISLGKLKVAEPFEEFIPRQLRINEFEMFDIRFDHIARIISLPLHHRDPFDRLLISQSLVENFPIVSIDSIFDSYGAQRLW